MTLCKFCENNPPVKRSHIIPEFMYKHTYSGKHPKMVVVNEEIEQLGERQKGYYEPLLCPKCEGFFNDNFEKPCISFIESVPNTAIIGSNLKVKPPREIVLLMLSIIWRASHATGNHWNEVELGSHQEAIKICLQNKFVKTEYSFWLFLSAYPDGKIEKGIVTSIQKIKVSGHNFYHFISSGIQFIVKISSHKIRNINPEPMDFSREIFVPVCDLRDSPSMRLIFTNEQ